MSPLGLRPGPARGLVPARRVARRVPVVLDGPEQGLWVLDRLVRPALGPDRRRRSIRPERRSQVLRTSRSGSGRGHPVAGRPASGHPMPVRPCAESARGRARPGRPGLGRPGSMTMARPCPTGGGARRARLGAGVELVAQAAALQQVGRLLPHHRQPVLGRSTLLVRCRCPVPWGGRGCGQAVGDIGPAGLSVSRPTVRRVVVRPAVRASRDGRPFAVRCHG
jgi:hypothetical protein